MQLIKYLSSQKWLLISCLILLAYYLPYVVIGKDATILIHDNLDSNIVWVKLLIENNALFSYPSELLPNALNGLPRYQVYPYYDFPMIVFKLFGIYWGYVINKFIVGVIGFFGMFFLLRYHFLPKNSPDFILYGVSLLYALLPFWSFTATVSGLPFVLYAFLNFRSDKNFRHNWVIVVLFTFHSSLVLSGIFLLLILGLIFAYDVLRNKRINWTYLLGLAVLVGCYLITHYPLIYGTLDGEVSHRVEWLRPATEFSNSYTKAKNIFKDGQYHAHSLHTEIWPILGIIFLLNIRKLNKKILLIIFFILTTSFYYGFSYYLKLKPISDRIFEILPIQWERFHYLHPMFWYILFALALAMIAGRNLIMKSLAAGLLLFQTYYVTKNHELWINRDYPTYNEFFSKSTFERIKNKIDRPVDSYKVICVGFHPAVAQYNNFHTLDGYFPSYPLRYKHTFREIIEEELQRGERLRKYYDNWGNRCYSISYELGINFTNLKSKSIKHLKYNFERLKQLNGEYVLSMVPIDLKENRKLELVTDEKTPDDFYQIFVYKVNP